MKRKLVIGLFLLAVGTQAHGINIAGVEVPGKIRVGLMSSLGGVRQSQFGLELEPKFSIGKVELPMEVKAENISSTGDVEHFAFSLAAEAMLTIGKCDLALSSEYNRITQEVEGEATSDRNEAMAQADIEPHGKMWYGYLRNEYQGDPLIAESVDNLSLGGGLRITSGSKVEAGYNMAWGEEVDLPLRIAGRSKQDLLGMEWRSNIEWLFTGDGYAQRRRSGLKVALPLSSDMGLCYSFRQSWRGELETVRVESVTLLVKF